MAPRDRKDVTASPATGIVAEIKIRVRGELRAKLAESAQRYGIPLNAEVSRRLEQSFEIDALKQELEAERQTVRDYIKEFSARETEYQKRINQLTDYLLQITAPKALMPKDDAA